MRGTGLLRFVLIVGIAAALAICAYLIFRQMDNSPSNGAKLILLMPHRGVIC